ncbi:inositol monophosphatase family protein [Thioalkalivibrio paradoxus]|uniref:Inositol-1-monophosphatase n=1 Tax=Thioalkalivibrio paradoxus ARh 1 TaxID=713585 RepID=W0DKX8_9GAMM|nr:inositol monophosphatase family protein [Thioalkalivibrio paradoxus]AHE97892.1 inositol monophosphatase [Thioalkalivibrio paradoxus ARh 1]
MHPMLNTAIKAARAAGRVTTRAWDRPDKVSIREKTRNDFVTEVDLQAEQTIVQILRQAYPDHGILAEEGGHQAGDDYVWVIDPLDGTTNFLHSVPHFAISIALRHRGRLEQAVVYNPIGEELFTASRGGGAFLNDRRIRVGQRADLHGALLGTGIPFRDEQNLDRYLATLRALIPDTAGVRRPGSAALDLAYVAAGRFDGFWEMGLRDWDIAAGVLLVQEAGGLVSDWEGKPDVFRRGDVVAGNPKVLKAMLQRLRAALAADTATAGS